MKPYQLSGLSFLVYLHRNGLSGILGDEMGLGKTLQTLSLFQYLKEHDPPSASKIERRPFLVVCPLSVLSSWMAEASRWVPELKVMRFHGPVKERDRLKRIAEGSQDRYGNELGRSLKKPRRVRTKEGKPVISLDTDSEDDKRGFDVVVTTYETFQSEKSWFNRAFVWRYVVLDEGHKIKNDLSLVATSLQGLKAEFRLILTGFVLFSWHGCGGLADGLCRTPLQNNLTELWALLHWLYPEVFTDNTSELFRSSFDLGKGQISTRFMDDARRLLELIMLRRMKNSPSVNLNLPPKDEVLLYVPLSPMQRFWYKRLLTRTDKGLLEEVFQGAKDKEVEAWKEEEEEEGLAVVKEEHSESITKAELLDESLETLKQKNLAEGGLLVPKNSSMSIDVEMTNGIGGDKWAETKAIMKKAVEMESQDKIGRSAWQKLMNLLMQLRKVRSSAELPREIAKRRQCCSHPYLMPSAEPDPYVMGDHLIRASGKFIVLDKLIDELMIRRKEKVLFFSGFTRLLDLCEELLMLKSNDDELFKYVRLDGSTARARRNLNIRLFNSKPGRSSALRA